MHQECLNPGMNHCTNSKDAKGEQPRLSQAAVTVQHLQEMTVLEEIQPHPGVKLSCSQPLPRQRRDSFLHETQLGFIFPLAAQ